MGGESKLPMRKNKAPLTVLGDGDPMGAFAGTRALCLPVKSMTPGRLLLGLEAALLLAVAARRAAASASVRSSMLRRSERRFTCLMLLSVMSPVECVPSISSASLVGSMLDS